ncbi:2-dehydropantoate 2-reductase [BD1-7 clade bacterium]|uniref:2-dehydropantoate 2-reductase n=1 Tax=BD1-7 clade bacterium TaxID=2029982 RepID=A0A5S9P6I1_9GAMM|nr:2-dehydropantoate 2-reductase [BD1-7 clade bacterium]
MRLAIIGGGAVGQYLAARLKQAKNGIACDVLMYRPRQETGLSVDSVDGDISLPDFQWKSISAAQPGDYDTFIITTKTTTMEPVGRFLAHVLFSSNMVWNTQNGWGNEDWLRRYTGHQNFGVMAVNFGVSRYSDSQLTHHVGNMAVLGGGSYSARSSMTRLLASAGMDVVEADSEFCCRLRKLIWNVPFSGLALVTGRYPCDLANDPVQLKRIELIMSEIARIAEHQGISIDQDYRQILLDYTKTIEPGWPSMVQDYQAGRLIEVEYIYQNLLKEAALLHITTPHIRHLYHDIVKAMRRQYLDSGGSVGQMLR